MTDSAKNIYSFSGMNSGRGFISFYDDIFREDLLSGLYIIKGGAGTGKSSFIRKLSRKAEDIGCSIRYCICGSDAGSLDGALITSRDGRSAGVLDGTLPHPRELVSPGASGEILNFGTYWKSAALRSERQVIDRLAKEKAAAFSTAYRYLGAAEQISRHITDLTRQAYLPEKAMRAATRLVREYGDAGEIRHMQLTGMTMKGRVTLVPEGGKRVVLSGDKDTAVLFMADVVRAAGELGADIRVSYSHLDAKSIQMIYFPHSGALLTYEGDENDSEKINMHRFTDSKAASLFRQKLRFGKRCREALTDGALEALATVKEYHFELERIYGERMDFAALSFAGEKWADEILSLL